MSQEVLPSMSLVMTCYNQHSFIEEALTSALKMEYSGDKELIIVDDASTDDSLQIMEKVLESCPHDTPVQIIKLETNRGVAGAVDAGIAAAQYDWIVLLDGDDVQCPDRLINTAELIANHPEVGLVAMSALRIDECGRVFGVLPYHMGGYYVGETPPELYLETPQERLKNMFHSKDHATVSAYGCSMSVRRDILQKWGTLVPAHYEGARFAQDPVLQAWCTLSAPILGSKLVACQYRSHSGNILNRSRKWDFHGYIQHELFMSGFSAFFASTLQQISAAIDRASKNPQLTDFSAGELAKYKALTNSQLAAYRMRSHWWEICWFARVWRTLQWYPKVPAQFRKWPFLRLIPLRLFCYLKFYKKERWKK